MSRLYHNSNIWDRLQTCVIGRVWSPDFFYWVKDATVRNSLEKITEETNEDLQGIVNCLQKLGVTVLRPEISNDHQGDFRRPPIDSHDNVCMIDNTLIVQSAYQSFYKNVIDHVSNACKSIVYTDNKFVCGAQMYQFTDKILMSQEEQTSDMSLYQRLQQITNKPIYKFHQHGHIDGWFTPVTPGLIISSSDPARPQLMKLFYKTHFPDWEVIYLEPTVTHFQQYDGSIWKKYLLAGQENNAQLLDFIDRYLHTWLGDIAETVFEINMLIVDSKNVLTSRYDKHIFNRLEKYGVTPHLCQHRYDMFWDSGLSCITADLDRHN